ncbi:WG repeat-containing protein [Micromonospora sp. C31]|uniref:WG repeat-containing protein n=1 Tax=Micromonospora sp. C31 TaxID=2824876 RepID=UPI001B3839E7|nr:WG repeat-containing protein [Micromonospora sp. C31]
MSAPPSVPPAPVVRPVAGSSAEAVPAQPAVPGLVATNGTAPDPAAGAPTPPGVDTVASGADAARRETSAPLVADAGVPARRPDGPATTAAPEPAERVRSVPAEPAGETPWLSPNSSATPDVPPVAADPPPVAGPPVSAGAPAPLALVSPAAAPSGEPADVVRTSSVAEPVPAEPREPISTPVTATTPPTAPVGVPRAPQPVPAPDPDSVPARPVSAPPAASTPAGDTSPVPPTAELSTQPVSVPPTAEPSPQPVSAPPADAPVATGAQDTGAQDTGAQDTGAQDTGARDTGTNDVGERDAGRLSAAHGDPEQVLASYRWQLDPAALREIVAEPDEFRLIRRRLTEKLGAAVDNKSRARLLSLRAVVSRILGELDDALADGRLALTYAEATGELRRTAVAQARLAHVLRWRGEFVEADRLFAEANSTELPERLRAVLHEHAGRSCYDQGRLMEACHHFERALDLRGTEDPELQARIRLSLDAVAERVAETGFGPYPRSREEVLERDRPPAPARDGDLWGFSDPDGDMVIAAEYAEAQPFRDGLAWVRRPETGRWSLIDRTGATVLEPSYPVVRPFSDGLAWVCDDGDAGWVAIDATGEVVVPHGFADVRPFSRGVAVVRRDGWGAVDRNGRIVVPTRHHGFSTVLADGRYVEGFTEEGLAVVDVAGRRGVVNRAGKMLVPPTHPALVIHPVAFLVGDGTGRWGALDRRGEPLIEPVHRDRDEVVAEIERLLVDASPVL